AQAVADRWGLPLDQIPCTETALLEPEPAHFARDLYFHPTVAVLDLMNDATRARGARIMLTGMGGDELMQAYGFEFAAQLQRGNLREALGWLGPRPTPRGLLRALRPLAPNLYRKLDVLRGRGTGTSIPWLLPEAANAIRDYRRDAERRCAQGAYPDV